MISSLCQNNPEPGGKKEKLIEQKQSFVQLRGEQAEGGFGYFDKVSFPFLAIFYSLGVNFSLSI